VISQRVRAYEFAPTLWVVDPVTNQITPNWYTGSWFSHILPSGEDVVVGYHLPTEVLYVGLNSGEFARWTRSNWYQLGFVDNLLTLIHTYDNVVGTVYLSDPSRSTAVPTRVLLGENFGELTWSPDRLTVAHSRGIRGEDRAGNFIEGLYTYRWGDRESVQIVSLRQDLASSERQSAAYYPCFLTFRPDGFFQRIS
jgi:hypothetical protein